MLWLGKNNLNGVNTVLKLDENQKQTVIDMVELLDTLSTTVDLSEDIFGHSWLDIKDKLLSLLNLPNDKPIYIEALLYEYTKIADLSRKKPFGGISYHLETPELIHNDIRMYIRFNSGRSKLWKKEILTLATIDIIPRGEGTFTKILEETKRICTERDWVLRIENVVNVRFHNYLLRNGFSDRYDPTAYGSLFWFHNDSIPHVEAMFNRHPDD